MFGQRRIDSISYDRVLSAMNWVRYAMESQLIDGSDAFLGIGMSPIFKVLLTIFCSSLIPITAIFFVKVRRTKKQTEFHRVVKILGIAVDEAEFARNRVTEQPSGLVGVGLNEERRSRDDLDGGAAAGGGGSGSRRWARLPCPQPQVALRPAPEGVVRDRPLPHRRARRSSPALRRLRP